MNWKDEIDKRHKGQSGFFKEIEQPKKRKRKTITMAKTKILLSIEEDTLDLVKGQAVKNERSTNAELRHLIKTALKSKKK